MVIEKTRENTGRWLKFYRILIEGKNSRSMAKRVQRMKNMIRENPDMINP